MKIKKFGTRGCTLNDAAFFIRSDSNRSSKDQSSFLCLSLLLVSTFAGNAYSGT
jgi:hypothetical protein